MTSSAGALGHDSRLPRPGSAMPTNMVAPRGQMSRVLTLCQEVWTYGSALDVTSAYKLPTMRVARPPLIFVLASGLDFHDRLLHCLIHGPANLMVGLRHAFRIEVPADHAEHAITVGIVEIGRDDIRGI